MKATDKQIQNAYALAKERYAIYAETGGARVQRNAVRLRKLEVAGDYTARLALLEALKGLLFGAVWDYYCLQQEVPVGIAFMDEIEAYEREELWRCL